MAAVILVVGFMGMIQAITIGSEMLATARRQTLANQIITHEVEKLRLLPWDAVSALPTASTSITIDTQFAASVRAVGLSTTAPITLTLTRSVANVTTDLREVTFTLQWTKTGTSAAATVPTGSWLQRLSFYRPSSSSRTYTRKMSAYFTRYGLNLSSQR